MAFCTKCGKELSADARFCSNCGAPTAGNTAGSTQRKTEYEGTIHKCPNCGEIVDAFKLNCPACGYEFRDSKTTNSVQELAAKLEFIEQQRPPKKAHTFKDEFLNTYGKFSREDEQKINLIRNFAIPNTKEDILEFMILASSNIDMKLYGTGANADETGALRAISDAWIAKFEQAYQKAEFSFSESPAFAKIQKIYFEKTKELNRQKKRKERETPLLFGMMFALIIIGLIALIIVR